MKTSRIHAGLSDIVGGNTAINQGTYLKKSDKMIGWHRAQNFCEEAHQSEQKHFWSRVRRSNCHGKYLRYVSTGQHVLKRNSKRGTLIYPNFLLQLSNPILRICESKTNLNGRGLLTDWDIYLYCDHTKRTDNKRLGQWCCQNRIAKTKLVRTLIFLILLAAHRDIFFIKHIFFFNEQQLADMM